MDAGLKGCIAVLSHTHVDRQLAVTGRHKHLCVINSEHKQTE